MVGFGGSCRSRLAVVFSGPYSYACCITCFVAYEFLGGVFPWFVWRVLCCRGGLCICLRSSLVYIVNS